MARWRNTADFFRQATGNEEITAGSNDFNTSETDRTFIVAFDEAMNTLGYDYGGSIGSLTNGIININHHEKLYHMDFANKTAKLEVFRA